MNLGSMSPSDTVAYFTQGKWGGTYEDDKFFKDEDIEDNFIVFCTYAFAYQNLPRPTFAQYSIALHLCDRSNPHRIVFASRGLGKSLFSELYVLWRLLRNPDERILVMSASSSRAINYSSFVQKLISLLPITRPMAPQHNKHRTSGAAFDVAGSSASDSPNMYAVGIGTAVTGFRATLVVADDIESSVSTESAVMSEKVISQFAESMNLLMSGRDESIILATPHSQSSIYIELIDRGWKLLALPAQVPSSGAMYFGGLAPYIEKMSKNGLEGTVVDERLDFDFLESKKMRIGKTKYNLQYMLDVSESDMMKYPLKLSDFIVDDVDFESSPLKITYSSMPDNMLYQKHNGFKADKLYKASYRSVETGEYEYKIMSIDTAGRGADELGIAIIYTSNSKMYIKKVLGLQGGYDDDVMKNISGLCLQHKIDTIVVEDNYGDGAFRKLLEPHIIRDSPKTEVEGMKVSGQKEVRIIETLEPILNQHRLVIDKEVLVTDFNVGNRAYSFTHQLSHITRERDSLKHDDRLDALANGVSFLLEFLSDSEDKGLELHQESEALKTLEFTLKMFSGGKRRRATHNFADSF